MLEQVEQVVSYNIIQVAMKTITTTQTPVSTHFLLPNTLNSIPLLALPILALPDDAVVPVPELFRLDVVLLADVGEVVGYEGGLG